MDGLIKAIRHQNLGVRWRAALALEDRGEPAVKLLFRHSRNRIRISAGWLHFALGKIGREAIPQLIRAMHEKDYDIRWHAVRIMAEIGEPAIPQLLSLLSEGDRDVQWQSALTLSIIGKPAVDSLILALRTNTGG